MSEVVVKNMIIAPNDIIDDIAKKFFTDGNIDLDKVKGNSRTNIVNPPIETMVEHGTEGNGAIRYKTYNQEEPNLVCILANKQEYTKVQFVYTSVDISKEDGMHFMMVKKSHITYEKIFNLSTRHGRMIFLATTFNPNKKATAEPKGKEPEQG